MSCWGSNFYGKLGTAKANLDCNNSAIRCSRTPAAVDGLTAVKAIGVGSDHACALNEDGTVRCWGSNAYGALGNGSTTAPTESATPLEVVGLTDATSLSVARGTGSGDYTCVLVKGGTVKCWGSNAFGQLGNDSAVPSSATPVQVKGITATVISNGSNHSCAVLGDTSVACWGLNANGAIGTVAPNSSYGKPVPIDGITGAVAVASGNDYSCALLKAGNVQCWGANDYSTLGDGGITASQVPVDALGGIKGFIAVSAGAQQACGVMSNGTKQCWGNGP